MKNRIRESIGLYNQKHRKEEEEKMTQKRLSELVLHDHSSQGGAREQLVGHWIEEDRKISFMHLRRLCKVLKVGAKFIIGL